MKVINLQEVSSTNTEIKKYIADGKNVILTAARQTGGMGTKGRSFLSEEGGLYLSALTFYKNLPAENAFFIMAHAAVAVCKTAEFFGAEPQIKWANDVFVNGKKLCGILIENQIAAGKVVYSIVGIGVNVCNPLSALSEIAISLREATGKPLSVKEVQKVLVKSLHKEFRFETYLHYVRFLGKSVAVTEGEKTYIAVAKNILPDGRLLIEFNGEERALSAAEISLKLTEKL